MNKLTLDQLKAMEPYKIFATGETTNNPEGINMSNDGRSLRWVACRGQIHDWAIYIGIASWSEQMIHNHGDKVTGENNIKKLIPCDDEAFEMYRY